MLSEDEGSADDPLTQSHLNAVSSDRSPNVSDDDYSRQRPSTDLLSSEYNSTSIGGSMSDELTTTTDGNESRVSSSLSKRSGVGGKRNHNEEDNNDEEAMKPFWFLFIENLLRRPRGKYWIILFWMILFILGLCFSFSLFEHTEFSLEAPDSSKAGKARKKLNHALQQESHQLYNMFYFSCDDGLCLNPKNGEQVSINDESLPLKNMSEWLRKELNEFNLSHSVNQVLNMSDYYYSLEVCNNYSSNDFEQQECEESAYLNYIGGDQNDSALFQVQTKQQIQDNQKHSMADFLNQKRKQLNQQYRNNYGIRTRLTGNLAIWEDMQEETAKSTDRSLLLTPLMFALVAYVVHSIRLMILSIIAVFFSVIISFLFILPFAIYLIDVSTIVPSVWVAIGVALALDYSIFLLSRFSMELRSSLDRRFDGRDGRPLIIPYHRVLDAVLAAVRWSGNVISVSGTILFLAFLIFLFVDMDFLRSFGLGNAIVVVVDASVVTTLVPSLILLFPEFFCVLGLKGMADITYDGDDPSDSLDSTVETELELTGGQLIDGRTQDGVIHSAGVDEAESSALVSATQYGSGGDSTTHMRSSQAESEYEELIKKKDRSEYTSANHDGLRDSAAERQGASDANPYALEQSYASLLTPKDIDRYDHDEMSDQELDALFRRMDESEIRWFRCTAWITRSPHNCWISGLVYLLILPISILSFQTDIQYGQNLLYPRDSRSYETFRRNIAEDFSPGYLAPFRVLIPVNSQRYGMNSSVWDYEYINDTSRIWREVQSVVNDSRAELDSVTGISVLGGTYFDTLSEDEYQQVYESDLYHAELDAMVSSDEEKSVFRALAASVPTGRHIRNIVRRLRDALKSACRRRGYHCYVYGNSVEYVDTVSAVFDLYPWLLISTVFVVLSYAAYIYQSGLLALRLAVTLVLPLAFIWGVFALIYQFGMLDWLDWAAVSSCGGPMWLTPVMANSILLGLSLDYECFLYARIYEYTTVLKMPLRTAVINAVVKTGDTITHAGILMCLSFVGMLFSSEKGVNQMGLLMIVGVLVDTFIIRTVLVPAVLTLRFSLLWRLLPDSMRPDWIDTSEQATDELTTTDKL